MSRHVNNVDYKVVMTGEGSDELFGGYPAFRRDMFLHGLDDLPQEERSQLGVAVAAVECIWCRERCWLKPIKWMILLWRPWWVSRPSCLQPWLACAPLRS